MSRYVNTRGHAIDLPDGTLVAPGESVDLDDESGGRAGHRRQRARRARGRAREDHQQEGGEVVSTATLYRPGTSVVVTDQPAPVSAPTDTDAWFIVGQTVYGVTGDYRLLRSLSDFTTLYGPRLATSVMYDCVETFFREGGARCYVSRQAPAGGTAASLTLKDSSAGSSLHVVAGGTGVYGNALTVAVVAAAGGGYQIVVAYQGATIETSPPLHDERGRCRVAELHDGHHQQRPQPARGGRCGAAGRRRRRHLQRCGHRDRAGLLPRQPGARPGVGSGPHHRNQPSCRCSRTRSRRTAPRSATWPTPATCRRCRQPPPRPVRAATRITAAGCSRPGRRSPGSRRARRGRSRGARSRPASTPATRRTA